MDADALFQALDIYRQLTAALLGMPRLFIIATVAPFMGGAVVTGQLRMVLVVALYLPLHVLVVDQLPTMQGISFSVGTQLAFLLMKECLLGLIIGFLVGLAFWAVQSAGFFIDNQRGASMAESADILSGESSSPVGNLLFQSVVYLFYVSGGFMVFMGVVYASYELWPVTSTLPLHWRMDIPLFFAHRVAWMLTSMLLLAAPITVACLLTDISLGLVNRFASQLNVYVLAMPLKSGIASFLLCFYFALLVKSSPLLLKDALGSIITFTNMLTASPVP